VKISAIAALSAFTVLSAEAGQPDRQEGRTVATCNNDGRCTTLSVVAPVKSLLGRRSSANSTMFAAKHQPPPLDANGNPAGVIVSGKTGARARVGTAYAVRFQAYIDDLENNYGARVLFMHGLRPGRCSISSEHPCGKALDVCQLRRGVVDRRCNLPGRVVLGQIAESHGLFEGGRWCNSDYGHAQVGVTAAACGARHADAKRQ
jgi:hypothetical protein